MDDAIESLLEKKGETFQKLEKNTGISFIAFADRISGRIYDSIKSIDLIGDEIGAGYEIILSGYAPGHDSTSTMKRIRREIPELQVVSTSEKIEGMARDIAFRNSSGKYLVPFSPELVYPVEYADILHSFMKFKIKRLFFSELPMLHRDLISDVGGWRPLRNGSDLDLFSRMAVNYGILACPTNMMWKDRITVKDVMGLRYPENMTGLSASERYLLTRDLIIACNHSLSDIREFTRIRKEYDGEGSMALMFLAFLGSRLSDIKPVSYNRNNLVVVMESLLESLVLKEYLKVDGMEDRVYLQIDRAHMEFLNLRSRMFKDMKASLSYFLRDQI